MEVLVGFGADGRDGELLPIPMEATKNPRLAGLSESG
jgi:hypothetical protein